jgi:hypothetical protein
MVIQDRVDGIGTFVMTVTSGIAEEIPCSIGRRDYIKIYNNSAVDVKILPDAATSITEGFLIKAATGTFYDNTNAPIYIQSTAASADVHIYERKDR